MSPHEYPILYHIRVAGHLDERWQRWFEGLQLDPLPGGETQLSGALDQSALHGILNRIRDLGLELISVQQMENTSDG